MASPPDDDRSTIATEGAVARWRKAERERLIAARQALPGDLRAAQTAAMMNDLDRLIPAYATVDEAFDAS